MTPRQAAAVGLGCWLVVAGPSGRAHAQIPGLPAGVGAGAAVPGASGAAIPGASSGLAGAATAAAPQKTIFGFFGLSKSNLAGCKAKICGSPLGTMLNGATAPYSTLSGGLIPQCCPTVPTDANIAALEAQGGPAGAGAVAAKVKQDEAEAKARRAAVRYLATVDCHYWPDAEVAIISALRDDRNECVRYEAALALLNGCCCNARTIAALEIVVAGSEDDGKPSETSERVRCAALAALQGCLLRYTPKPKGPPERPVPPESPRPFGALEPNFRRVAYYYQDLAAKPTTDIVAEARRTVARATAQAAEARPAGMPGERSVYHALARASTPKPAAAAPSPAPAPVAEAPAVAARPAPRRGIFSTPSTSPTSTSTDDRAVVPASAPSPSTSTPSTSPARRGLFGILRDSAGSRPGT